MPRAVGMLEKMPKRHQREYERLSAEVTRELARHNRARRRLRERYDLLRKKKGFVEGLSGIQAVRRSLNESPVKESEKDSPEGIHQQIRKLAEEKLRLQQICQDKHGHSWCHGNTCVICDLYFDTE